jgi:hypothetical protein
LNDVEVEAHNYLGQTNPIQFMGGKITLTNSKVSGFHGGGGMVQIINNSSMYPGTVTVINSILEGTLPAVRSQALLQMEFLKRSFRILLLLFTEVKTVPFRGSIP